MMGRHSRSEALFYYFRLEDQGPENHLLRLIDKHISFEFVRQQLKHNYSETGRSSIDPELLLRILLIGYLYGITSKRRLPSDALSSISTNQRGSVHESWRTHPSSRRRSGKERRWKPCSRNSRIRLGCGAYACAD